MLVAFFILVCFYFFIDVVDVAVAAAIVDMAAPAEAGCWYCGCCWCR